MSTAADKARCAEREVRWRLKVYPHRVAAGTMTEHEARRQIELMQEIAADYRALAAGETLQLPLRPLNEQDH